MYILKCAAVASPGEKTRTGMASSYFVGERLAHSPDRCSLPGVAQVKAFSALPAEHLAFLPDTQSLAAWSNCVVCESHRVMIRALHEALMADRLFFPLCLCGFV